MLGPGQNGYQGRKKENPQDIWGHQRMRWPHAIGLWAENGSTEKDVFGANGSIYLKSIMQGWDVLLDGVTGPPEEISSGTARSRV